MKDIGRPPPWYARWRRVERPSLDDDPADHGTAFGLELTLLDQGEPRGAPPDEESAASARRAPRLRWPLRRAAPHAGPRRP